MAEIYSSGEKVKKKVVGTRKRPSRSAKTMKQALAVAVQKELPKKSSSPVAAFSFYPRKVKFNGADKKEKIVLLLRKHPITNIRWILIAIAMILAPLAMSFLPLFGDLPANFQLIILMGWYLIVLAYIIEEFLGWYFNVNIVTDERIFDVDFVNLIYREITDANIDQIQDVTVRVGGVVRTVFNYGDVIVQTAAEIPQLEFVAVPKPDAVAQILRELRIEEEQEKLEGRVR